MSIASKIAFKITLAGLFVLAVFTAFSFDRQDGYFWAVFFFLLAFIIAFAVASSNHIAMPVSKFVQRAERLGQGDFSGRFFVQSKDELGYLSKVFDKIAQHLGQSKYEAKKLQEAFDSKIRNVTELMDETIRALEQKVKNRHHDFLRMAVNFEDAEEQLKLRELEIEELKTKIAKLKKKKAKASLKKHA